MAADFTIKFGNVIECTATLYWESLHWPIVETEVFHMECTTLQPPYRLLLRHENIGRDRKLFLDRKMFISAFYVPLCIDTVVVNGNSYISDDMIPNQDPNGLPYVRVDGNWPLHSPSLPHQLETSASTLLQQQANLSTLGSSICQWCQQRTDLDLDQEVVTIDEVEYIRIEFMVDGGGGDEITLVEFFKEEWWKGCDTGITHTIYIEQLVLP